MKFDLSSLTPRSELTAMFTRMKTLVIKADGKAYAGVCEIVDNGGNVTITVETVGPVETVTPLDTAKFTKGRKSK